jgi:Ca2+-binding RTX toxin-like protein
MRSKRARLLVLALGSVSLLLIGQPAAWAPTVGKPPAPGYPPCTKVGNDAANVIRGTKKRDVICADEGNDRVYGLAGNDVLFGGPGVDRLYGGPGDDEFHAWQHRDFLFGEEGNDWLNGELGNDVVVGGPGRDVLFGAEHDDCLVAVDGEVDTLKGMKGQDRYEADPDDVLDNSSENAADCYAKA